MSISINDLIPEQRYIIEPGGGVTVLGHAPQYRWDSNGNRIDITKDDPYWAIEKWVETTIGPEKHTTKRWANNSDNHDKVMSNWNSYTY